MFLAYETVLKKISISKNYVIYLCKKAVLKHYAMVMNITDRHTYKWTERQRDVKKQLRYLKNMNHQAAQQAKDDPPTGGRFPDLNIQRLFYFKYV